MCGEFARCAVPRWASELATQRSPALVVAICGAPDVGTRHAPAPGSERGDLRRVERWNSPRSAGLPVVWEFARCAVPCWASELATQRSSALVVAICGAPDVRTYHAPGPGSERGDLRGVGRSSSPRSAGLRVVWGVRALRGAALGVRTCHTATSGSDRGGVLCASTACAARRMEAYTPSRTELLVSRIRDLGMGWGLLPHWLPRSRELARKGASARRGRRYA